MADLVTRILLYDKQFNDNIQKSKKQTKDFEAGMGKLKLGMTAFAGAMGVAVSAGAIFQKVIGGSQALTDGFNNAMGAAKSTVNEFFSAMATGDTTQFVLGLDNVYKKALKVQEALDQLWNTQLSFDVTTFDSKQRMQEAREKALDREASPGDRQKGLEDWKKEADEIAGYTANLQKQILETVTAQVTASSALKSSDVSLPDIFDVFKMDINTPEAREKARKKAEADFKQYQKEYNTAINKGATVTTTFVPGGGGSTNVSISDEGKRAGAEVALKYKDAVLANSMLNEMNDEQLDAVGKNVLKYSQASIAVSQEYEKINKAKYRVENQIGAGSGGKMKAEEIIPDASIRAIENKLTEANNQLLLATSTAARKMWAATIKELEREKVTLEVVYKDSIGGVSSSLGVSSGVKLPTKLSSTGGGSFELPQTAMEEWIDKLKEAERANDMFVASAFGISDAMYSIAGATEGSASEWLRYGANVLGAAGQALPAIMALTTASKASATASAADASAKAAASVAAVPLVGPVLAVAAVASIIGALLSVPKFATGGIVGGASYSGDNMLARVNSGEMILNAGQQANLFKMVNTGGGSVGGGEIIGRVKGPDILFVLQQQMRKNSRL